jgi:hypothetical protein
LKVRISWPFSGTPAIDMRLALNSCELAVHPAPALLRGGPTLGSPSCLASLVWIVVTAPADQSSRSNYSSQITLVGKLTACVRSPVRGRIRDFRFACSRT